MAVLDTLKVVIEGDASGLQSAFTVATRVLQKLEAALDRLEASASKHTQATDRIAAAHTRMANTTKAAADKTAAVQAKAERDFFRLAQAAERGEAREAAAAGRKAAAIDRSIAKIHAAQERTKRDYDKAVAAAERAATREAAAAGRAAAAVTRAADKKSTALAKAAAKQEADSERSTASWAKEIAIFQRYRAALYLAGAGLQSVFKIAEEGARTASAEQFFRNSGKSIEEFRNATRGLVSDADLVKKSNLAENMGINSEMFQKLALVAQAAAAKTGQSYSHMLDSIIVGSARESRLLLDNLGIIINVTKAREDYIQTLRDHNQLGALASETNAKLAANLTDAAEKEAFLNAAMKSGSGMLKEMAEAGDLASESYDRLHAAIENVKMGLGKAISSALRPGIDAITELIENLSRLRDDDMLAIILSGGLAFLPGTGFQPEPDMGKVNEQFVPNVEFKERQLGILENLKAIGLTFEDAMGRTARQYTEQNAEVARAIQEFQALNKVTKLFRETVSGIQGVFAGGPAKKSPFKDDVGGDNGKEDATQKWLKKFDLAMQATDDFIQQQGIDLLGGIGEDAVEAIVSAAEASFYEYGRVRKAAMQAESDAWRDYENDLLEQAAKDKQKGIEDATQGVDQAHSVISAAMSGSASALGAGIGGFFGPLGTAIGSLIGELLDPLTPVIELLGHLASGIKGLLELGLNPFLETLRPLGPSLELLLRAVGVLIGSALRPLIPYMQGLVFIVAAVIDIVALVIVALAPVVELFFQVVSALVLMISVIWNIIGFFIGLGGGSMTSFTESMSYAAYWIDEFTKGMIDAIVSMNNGIVSFMRSIGRALGDLDVFDLEHFGDRIQSADLMPPPDPTIEENTDATDDNTRAVEQLSRDLRNLPSGYKVNYALYGATAPAGVLHFPRGNLAGALAGSAGRPPNFRWRT